MAPACRKKIRCREIFVFRRQPWVKVQRRCVGGLHRHPSEDGTAGNERQNVNAGNRGRDSPSRAGRNLLGRVVCQLTFARTDGSWQSEVISALAGSVARVGSGQTTTAAEQARFGAANGEG